MKGLPDNDALRPNGDKYLANAGRATFFSPDHFSYLLNVNVSTHVSTP